MMQSHQAGSHPQPECHKFQGCVLRGMLKSWQPGSVRQYAKS